MIRGDFTSSDVVLEDLIQLSAEAVDVNIECLRDLHFGCVRANLITSMKLNILNKGKHSVEFV